MRGTQKKYFSSKNWPSEQYQKFCSPKKKFVAGSIPVMRKNASCFAPQGTNLNFRKNCILSACNPIQWRPGSENDNIISNKKRTKKLRNVFFLFFFFVFFVFFPMLFLSLLFFFFKCANIFSDFFAFFLFFQVFPAFKSVFNFSDHTVPGWSPTPVLRGLKPR